MAGPGHHHDEPGDVRRERLARAFQPARGRAGTLTPVLAGLGLAALIALVVGLVGAIRAPEREALGARALSGAPSVPAPAPARSPRAKQPARAPAAPPSSRSSAAAPSAPSEPAVEQALPEPELAPLPPEPAYEAAPSEAEPRAEDRAEQSAAPLFATAALAACPPATEGEAPLTAAPPEAGLAALIEALVVLARSDEEDRDDEDRDAADEALAILCPEPAGAAAQEAPAYASERSTRARSTRGGERSESATATRRAERSRALRQRAAARARAARAREARRARHTRRARPARARPAPRRARRPRRRSEAPAEQGTPFVPDPGAGL